VLRFMVPSEILRGGTQNDLIDFHLSRLFNGVEHGASNRIGRLTTASIPFLRRAPMTTFAPCRARSLAMLSPMPLLAPVITTTLSAMFDVPIFYSSLLRIRVLGGHFKNH